MPKNRRLASGLFVVPLVTILLIAGCAVGSLGPSASGASAPSRSAPADSTSTASSVPIPTTSEQIATESYVLPSGESVSFAKDDVPDAVIDDVASKAAQFPVSEGMPLEKLDTLYDALGGTNVFTIISMQGFTREDASNPNAQPRTVYQIDSMQRGVLNESYYSFDEAFASASQHAAETGGKVLVVDK